MENMKMSKIINQVIVVGFVFLTLVSCGGGGGGGGASPEKGNKDTTNNITPQDKVKMPEQLTAAMDLTLEQNGVETKLDNSGNTTSLAEVWNTEPGIKCLPEDGMTMNAPALQRVRSLSEMHFIAQVACSLKLIR